MSDVRMEWHGDRVMQKAHRGAVRGLRDASETLLTESNQTIPLETGAMMRGGVASVDEARLEAAVSYGNNESAPYTVKQHEELHYRHDPGRRAKWLEATLNETRERLQAHIAKSIEDALRW